MYKYPYEFLVDRYQLLMFKFAHHCYVRRYKDFYRKWEIRFYRLADTSIHRQGNRPRGRRFLDELEIRNFNRFLKEQ